MDSKTNSGPLQTVRTVGGNLLVALGTVMDQGWGKGAARLGRWIRGEAGKSMMAQVADDVKQIVNDGRASPERFDSPDTRTACAELLDDVATAVPDQRRLEVLRRAFLAVAIGDPKDSDGTMGLVFMRLARRLSGEGAVVLGAAFRIRTLPDGQQIGPLDSQRWQELAMKQTKISYREAFRDILLELGRLRLVTTDDAGSPTCRGEFGTLTQLGLGFCEFLERAGPFEAPSSPAAD